MHHVVATLFAETFLSCASWSLAHVAADATPFRLFATSLLEYTPPRANAESPFAILTPAPEPRRVVHWLRRSGISLVVR
jgi:hypothetical protein